MLRRAAVLAALALAALPAAAPAAPPGAQTLKYRFGPIPIRPGQNTINLRANDLKPPEPGYIVGFRPDLERRDGSIPRVDVIHLHHAVWLSNWRPLFAAGEEKSHISVPPGYGWWYDPSDRWVLNDMIHNLTPSPDEVYVTYEVDFIPASSPAAQGIRRVQTVWMDVMGLMAYPVFDVRRNAGGGRYTYPDESRQRGYTRNRWRVERDGALVSTVGHLHPGGLWTDLELTRNGRTVRLFRSEAKYFEPAGAVSWDVAMTASPPSWRVGVKRGDVVSVSATYDSRRAAWYEAMGIMPVAFDEGGTGPDPLATRVDVPGTITHGHLPENDNHGGGPGGLPNARRLLAGPRPDRAVGLDDFRYLRGDLTYTGRKGRPPTVPAGRRLRFVNREARRVMHTITACKSPCNRRTGIAYPLADAPVQFDSGNLGFGPRGFTAAANRASWRTPRDLDPGTYTYFCRVHPFMRGAFRVRGRN